MTHRIFTLPMPYAPGITMGAALRGPGAKLLNVDKMLGDPDGTPHLIWAIASTVSMAASAFHGYRRNESVGWALWWGLMGGLFPIITPVIGVAQGFGRRK